MSIAAAAAAGYFCLSAMCFKSYGSCYEKRFAEFQLTSIRFGNVFSVAAIQWT